MTMLKDSNKDKRSKMETTKDEIKEIEYKFETTENNTRTFLCPKNCEFFVDAGVCCIEKGKTWKIEELLSFFKKLKGIKIVKPTGFYGYDDEDFEYKFLYEKKKGYVSISVSKGLRYKNIKFCPKISLQIPPENNSFEVMKELIEKINNKFKVKIFSAILEDLVTIKELKSVDFEKAEKISYLKYLVRYYMYLKYINKPKQARKFIKGKISKSDFLKIKESLLKKDYIKFGYMNKLIKENDKNKT